MTGFVRRLFPLLLPPLLLLIVSSATSPLFAQDWKAGVARARITPARPLWMAGYGSRERPSEGTAQELHAKALALKDQNGKRVVLVTADILGFPQDLARRVTRQAERLYELPREAIMLNASHTHAGPVVGRNLAAAYPTMTDKHWADVDDYTRELEDQLVRLIGRAVEQLAPARLRFERTRAGFAVNRRRKTQAGYRGGGDNWEGPVDHDVPVLRVEDAAGDLRAIVFGYACHNTAIRGDFYEFHGGWAGSAQKRLEQQHPGVTALFVMGCGADANPYPRGNDLPDVHGDALAGMIEQALERPGRPVRGALRTAYEEFPLAFAAPPSREKLEAMFEGDNPYHRYHAREMLKVLDQKGRLPAEYPYPAQVWKLGDDLTLVALAGEVVADYALRLKRELGADKLWVAGYSNDVFAYIPSRRVLEEGGYEASGAMIYYLQPGPFTPSVEETIIRKVHELVKRTH